MLLWLFANMGTILVCLALAAIVGVVIACMVRAKRKGKTACGCSCQGCPMNGSCHK